MINIAYCQVVCIIYHCIINRKAPVYDKMSVASVHGPHTKPNGVSINFIGGIYSGGEENGYVKKILDSLGVFCLISFPDLDI